MKNEHSTRATEALRRRISKNLAGISYIIVANPLTYEQLSSLDLHVQLMFRVIGKERPK